MAFESVNIVLGTHFGLVVVQLKKKRKHSTETIKDVETHPDTHITKPLVSEVHRIILEPIHCCKIVLLQQFYVLLFS